MIADLKTPHKIGVQSFAIVPDNRRGVADERIAR